MGVEFRPEEILRVLADHKVSYVLVGGLAAAAHGSAHVTTDVDVTPALTEVNLDRLSSALYALGARIRTPDVPDGLPFSHTGATLGAVRVWNLMTESGDLDLTFMPLGTTGYDDLVRDAIELVILDVPVPVASLADVIRSKEAADRPKDRLALPVLRRTLEEQQRRSTD